MSPLGFGIGKGLGFFRKFRLGFTYSGFNISLAVDGIVGNSTNPPNSSAEQTTMRNDHNAGGTATFSPGIPYNRLDVVYGNMANGQLGNPNSGAVLSINGTTVTANGPYGSAPYNSVYHKIYVTTTPGTLNSIGISPGVSGSHESGIYEIYIDNVPLTATLA